MKKLIASQQTKEAKYEEDILASFEKGEWRSVPNLKDEIARYAASDAATLTKDKRIKYYRSHEQYTF